MFCPYSAGERFVIYTDHQGVKWLLGSTDVSGRLARWRIRLCEFDFSLEYRKGKKNTIADAISHLPTTGEKEVDPDLDVPVLTLAPARLSSAKADDVAEGIFDEVDELEFTASV